MSDARKTTIAVIENVENGLLTWEAVARACLSYMSEYDVDDMARCEGLVEEEEEEDPNL